MASAQALLTLIMGSISKTTIGVTTSSLAERKGCSSHSFLTLVASIGRPVSSHASRRCGQRHCQLNGLIALQTSLPLTAVASKSESASSNLPPGIAVSPPCDRNVLARWDKMTYKSLIRRPRGYTQSTRVSKPVLAPLVRPIMAHPLRPPKSPNKTAALLKAGTSLGHGSVSGSGTCEAKFLSACSDSSVRGPSSVGGGRSILFRR